MNEATSFRAFGLASAALFGALAFTGCGGDTGSGRDGDDGDTGGTAGTPSGGTAGTPSGGTAGTPSGGTAGTPSGGTAGTPSGGTGGTTGGSAGTASGGTAGAACEPNPPVQTCGGMVPPADGVLLDVATYMASGSWGAGDDITGGTSYYVGRDVSQLTLAVEGTSLHITGTLPPYTPEVSDDAENYAGVVFWFGPCVNASGFGGVSFETGGTLGGAAMKLQVQTHLNYPVDTANAKGACQFTNCDTRWSECKGPDMTVTVPATPETLELPWSSFTAGLPNAEVTPEGLVGLQFQFECQAMTECAVDVTIGTINLLPL